MNSPTAIRRGIAVPILMDNINTDLIIRSVDINANGSGLGSKLFQSWRMTEDQPGHVLDQPQYQGSRILLTGSNFGCGSSREAAVWALRDFGIDTIIAASYSDIFFANCLHNQIAPITLRSTDIESIATTISRAPEPLTIDLEAQLITLTEGTRYRFTLDPTVRLRLVAAKTSQNLLDEHAELIRTSFQLDRQNRSWVYQTDFPSKGVTNSENH